MQNSSFLQTTKRGDPWSQLLLGPPPEKVLAGGEREGNTHTSALSVRDHRRGGKRATGGSVRACLTAAGGDRAELPGSRPPAPGRCVGSRRPAAREASRRRKAPARPASRAPLPNLPRAAGKSARERKKGASPRPRGSVLRRGGRARGGDRGGLTVAAPRWVPAARGAPSPAPPAKLSFWFAPPEKCGRGGGGRRAGLAAAAG